MHPTEHLCRYEIIVLSCEKNKVSSSISSQEARGPLRCNTAGPAR